VPPGSTFEADLRAVREARGLSLDEIQRETRIPVDVLRRFEEGGLIGDPTYNPVYLKAFLQSYAGAVGLPQGEVLAAYEAHERGAYQGGLGPGSDASPAPAASPSAPEAASPAPLDPAPTESTPTESGARPPARPGAAPAVEALANAPAEPEPAPSKAEAAPAQTRVSRPTVPTARRSFDKNWGTIIGIAVVATLLIAAAVYFLVFAGDDEPEADTVEALAVGETAIDTAGVGAGAAAGGPRLQLPLSVTVLASGDGLQDFRVTEGADDRRPYWIEPGDEQTFTDDSVLVFWGENADGLGPEAMLEFQGQRFTPSSGSVLRISAQNGQRLLDSLAGVTPPVPAEAEGSL
jgi:type II secretory pathway pseudopilin PulG